MKRVAILVWILGTTAAFGAPGPSSIQFEPHVIDRIGSQLGQTALADVDRDGDLDYICGQSSRASGDIWWWEYRSPAEWIRHPIGKGNTDVGGAAFDVNEDGWVDVLAGSVLFLNSGSPLEVPFSPHNPGTIYSHDTEFADLNGDGRMDALANSDLSGLFWYEIPADPTHPWTSHTIATADQHKVHGGISPRAVGDLDGDGDADVVTGEAWYENTDGRGLRWRMHRTLDFGEHHQYGLAVRTWVGDLDGDGDNDIVQAEADNPAGRVAWFENNGRGELTFHLVKDDRDRQDFHSLAVADFDNDGDLDIFSGGGPLTADRDFRCYIWENVAEPNRSPGSTKWIEHIIARRHCHEAVAGDVDADGDIDLCFKPWSGENEHIYLRNLLVEVSE